MRLTIHDLERDSGLSRRTIHFYAQAGLLPAPAGSGPSSTYGEEHLLRLRLIPTLKTAGLRLDRIGCALDGLSLAEMRRLVHLASDSDLSDPVRLAEWLQRGRDGDGVPTGPSSVGNPATGNGPHPGDTDGDPGASVGAGWVRQPLAPGVELRFCPSLDDTARAKLRQLGELARKLFEG